jgi:hypothetical protein
VRSRGYEVTATEFVPSVHTPKNRLLIAIRRGLFHQDSLAQYERLKAAVGGTALTLEQTLNTAADAHTGGSLTEESSPSVPQ